MSRTIKAELHYGYNLGDTEDGWQFAEVDDDEYNTTPTMPWWDEDGDGLGEQAMPVLLAATGFTEDGSLRTDAYYDRYREAVAKIGVAFEITGYEGGRTLLVAKGTEHTAYTSGVTEIDPAVLASTATEAMDRQLADALRVLGITPKQTKPAWLLTCYYG